MLGLRGIFRSTVLVTVAMGFALWTKTTCFVKSMSFALLRYIGFSGFIIVVLIKNHSKMMLLPAMTADAYPASTGTRVAWLTL
jgi:hypothetical protein